MTELEKQELIQKGRDFLHYRVEQEEIETDQKLKRQQPPLVKAPMRDEMISLPKNYNDIYADKGITMGAAIAYSDNIYAVKTHLFLGEEK